MYGIIFEKTWVNELYTILCNSIFFFYACIKWLGLPKDSFIETILVFVIIIVLNSQYFVTHLKFLQLHWLFFTPAHGCSLINEYINGNFIAYTGNSPNHTDLKYITKHRTEADAVVGEYLVLHLFYHCSWIWTIPFYFFFWGVFVFSTGLSTVIECRSEGQASVYLCVSCSTKLDHGLINYHLVKFGHRYSYLVSPIGLEKKSMFIIIIILILLYYYSANWDTPWSRPLNKAEPTSHSSSFMFMSKCLISVILKHK